MRSRGPAAAAAAAAVVAAGRAAAAVAAAALIIMIIISKCPHVYAKYRPNINCIFFACICMYLHVFACFGMFLAYFF